MKINSKDFRVRRAQEFRERLDYMQLNPVWKGFINRSQDWEWSSYNSFALDKVVVAGCPVQVDYVHLPEGYRA